MKTLNQYITESKSEDFFCEQFSKMFKGIKFTKESVKMMLDNLDMDVLKTLSDYFNNNDSSNYMSYEPNADLFTNDDNKDKITTQLSEYISKFIAN